MTLKKILILLVVLCSLVGGYIFFVLPSKIVPILQQVIAEKTDLQFSADKQTTIKFSTTFPQFRIFNIKLAKDGKELSIKQALFILDLKAWAQNHFSTKNLPINKITLFNISGEKLAIPDFTIKTEADNPASYIVNASGIYNFTQYTLSGYFMLDKNFSLELSEASSKINLTGKIENQQLAGILKAEQKNFPQENATTSVIAEIGGPFKNLSVPTFQAIITYRLKQAMIISGDIKTFKPIDAYISFKGDYEKYNTSGVLKINDTLFDLSHLKLKLDHTLIENADIKINLANVPEFKSTILADTLNFKEFAGTIYFVQNAIKNAFKPQKVIPFSQQYSSDNYASQNETYDNNADQNKSLDIQKFKTANGSVIIHANQIVSNNGKKLGLAEIKGELKDGVLQVPVLNIGNFLNGTINAQIVGDKSITAKANLIAKNLPLATFVNNISTGSVSGIVNLETTSSTKDGLIQNANGLIKLAGQNITYVPRFKLLQQLTGSKNTKEVIFKCGVINTPVKDGVIVSDQKIAFETEKQQILLNGMIDFGNKQLDTKLKIDQAEVNLGTLLSDVSITGPFSGIRVRVDQNKAFDNLINLGFSFLKGKKKQEQIKRTLNNVCQKAIQ